MRSKDHLAWHGRVEILHWEHTSNNGARVKLGLESRDSLEYFDTLTRRTSRRTGQRFEMYWQDLEGAALPDHLDLPRDGQFCGAQWSQASGASIVLWVMPHELDQIAMYMARDQRETKKYGDFFFLALVEMDDDGMPVNQKKRARLESALATQVPDEFAGERPKGGPISKNAGMLANEQDFQRYVCFVTGKESVNAEDCAAFIRHGCRVESRALLDHDAAAARRYQDNVKGPYLVWLGA